MSVFTTRFAPSPTGPLHLGHAYSALLAFSMARTAGGHFLLRIEDIDRARSKPHWETQIFDDLQWLGVRWDAPPIRQQDRQPAYDTALQTLWAKGLLYPCHCTRRDIADAASAPQEGASPAIGPDGVIYPGTCRPATPPTGPLPRDTALRLDMARATASKTYRFFETGAGPDAETGTITFSGDDAVRDIGDIVLARKAMGTSYHLAVVVDDAAQDITHVVRGQDLFAATRIHVILQELLGLPQPIFHHHRLIRDETGKRLAKRDDARAISTYRAEGKSPDDIRKMVGL